VSDARLRDLERRWAAGEDTLELRKRLGAERDRAGLPVRVLVARHPLSGRRHAVNPASQPCEIRSLCGELLLNDGEQATRWIGADAYGLGSHCRTCAKQLGRRVAPRVRQLAQEAFERRRAAPPAAPAESLARGHNDGPSLPGLLFGEAL